MKVAGIAVSEHDIIHVAQLLRRAGRNDVADTLETALIQGFEIAPLDNGDHEAILRVLGSDHADLTAALFEQVLRAKPDSSQGTLREQPASD